MLTHLDRTWLAWIGDTVTLETYTQVDRHSLFFHLWQIETEHMGLSGNRQHTEAIVDQLLQLRDEMEQS